MIPRSTKKSPKLFFPSIILEPLQEEISPSSNFLNGKARLCRGPAHGGMKFWECLGWARGEGAFGQKASALPFRISNCGFRILGFSFSIRIPQSTIRNSDGPPVPWNQECLMIFACNALALGPGNQSQATFRWWLFQSALSDSLVFVPPFCRRS